MTGNLLQVHQFRNISYQSMWDYQEVLHQKLIQTKRKSKSSNTLTHHLIFCEHNPVYTLGKSGSIANLLLQDAELQNSGFEFFKINRGGDITYHGPGQWTVYPILDLDSYYHDVHRYVREIELTVIDTLAEYGISGFPVEDFTGVWTGAGDVRKLCAIGVHLSRWVSLHGLALNVNTDLSNFKNIVPCGIATPDKSVTSMEKELGKSISMEEVKARLIHHFTKYFPVEEILSVEE